MKCLQCKWDDKYAPERGKCCGEGECGLCPLCEQATLYTKAKQLYNSSKNPLSFLVKSNVNLTTKEKNSQDEFGGGNQDE